MLRLPAPVCAVALLAIALLGPMSMPVSAADPAEDAKLEKFFKNYLDLWMAQRPLEATQLGNHDFDDVLEDVSAESRKNWEALVRKTLESLPKEVSYAKLSRGSQIDYEIFKHHLERTLWVWDNIRPFETDPRTYGEYITNSIFLPLRGCGMRRR